MRCCDFNVFESLDEKCTYATLHNPDDRSVMRDADGITLGFQSNFVRMQINTALLTTNRICEDV